MIEDWQVIDLKGATPGKQLPVLGRFDSEEEASKFIATLPEFETGRYGLDGPNDYDDEFDPYTGDPHSEQNDVYEEITV